MISNFHVQVEHMISEKNILSSLDHPFIVRLAGTFQGGGIIIRFNSSSCTLVINDLLCLSTDPRYLYMVLEYIVGGEFFTHLRKTGRFDHSASKFYATQISLIFEYMHASDFIYRDLKPENFVIGYGKQ